MEVWNEEKDGRKRVNEGFRSLIKLKLDFYYKRLLGFEMEENEERCCIFFFSGWNRGDEFVGFEDEEGWKMKMKENYEHEWIYEFE